MVDDEFYYTLAEVRLIADRRLDAEYGNDLERRLELIAELIDKKHPELTPVRTCPTYNECSCGRVC